MKTLNTMDLSEFFQKAKARSLLMIDYDGTLAPLVPNRMEAHPYPHVTERLLALLQLKNTRVVLVSGRSLNDLEALFDLPSSLEVWASHGMERRLSTGKKFYAPLNPKLIEGLKKGVQLCLETASPKQCEIKPFSVALHWRGLEPAEKWNLMESVEAAWNDLIKEYDLEIHRFDGGIELRTKGRNKGSVVQDLLKEIKPETAVAYLGDDLTDEDAFKELGERGLKVLVREIYRPTLADIHLVPPDELIGFLDQWIANE